jgi:hypothetical protein
MIGRHGRCQAGAMRSLLLIALASSFSFCVAQSAFPSIAGETSEGRSVSLPGASAGRPCVIAVAFSRKAEKDLMEWYEPAYLLFVDKYGIMVGDEDIDLWMVPVFTGLNKAAYGPSMKQLKEEADPEVASRVVFVKEEAAGWIDALGIKDRDIPYFFAVDAGGRLVHREQGAFTDDKLDALHEAVSE